MWERGARRMALLAFAPALLACSQQAAPLPQLLVVLDTDMPVVDQIHSQDPTRPELSLDATMDSVRIDAIDAHGNSFDFLDVTAPDPADWPITFGVITPTVRLRARLFRGQYAKAGVLDGSATLEPDAAITIDRVIDVSLPASGISTIEIVFSGDCLGVTPNFGAGTNCVDAAHPSAPSTDGIVSLPDGKVPPSLVGTWKPAVAVPCSKPGASPQVCIPGGFTLLGDDGLKGLADGIQIRVDSGPLRPVVLSPYYLDQKEFTVGEFDALRAAQPGVITEALPLQRDTSSSLTQYCNWLGGAGGNEHLPLNCVNRKTAAQICAARKGKLPSEARWEHAARGRGQHRPYPWGTASPSCCLASLGRLGNGCTAVGPEAVGSHPASCDGQGDVSRDGVMDLGGSVREHTLDALVEYTDPCWQGGLLRDPVCAPAGAGAFVSRGAAWKDPLWSALSALRQTDLDVEALDSVGFRCAYDDGAP